MCFSPQDPIEYKLLASGEAAQFFYLNPETGVITTKKFLTDTKTKEFKVSTQTQGCMNHGYGEGGKLAAPTFLPTVQDMSALPPP